MPISKELRSLMWEVGSGVTRPYLPPTASCRQEATAEAEGGAVANAPAAPALMTLMQQVMATQQAIVESLACMENNQAQPLQQQQVAAQPPDSAPRRLDGPMGGRGDASAAARLS